MLKQQLQDTLASAHRMCLLPDPSITSQTCPLCQPRPVVKAISRRTVCRVVGVSPAERSYHIFYMLCQGGSDDLCKKLKCDLLKCGSYAAAASVESDCKRAMQYVQAGQSVSG